MGLTPSKDITGGKVIGPAKKKVKNRAAGALRMAATTLLESDTHLGARYRYLRRQLPTFKSAVKAMARYLALLIYRLLTKGEACHLIKEILQGPPTFDQWQKLTRLGLWRDGITRQEAQAVCSQPGGGAAGS